MVKIEGLSEREKALISKKTSLVNITLQSLGIVGEKSRLLNPNNIDSFSLAHHSLESKSLDSPIVVMVDMNRILVYHRSYFEEARRLAGMYEDFAKEEFTIKKEYE